MWHRREHAKTRETCCLPKKLYKRKQIFKQPVGHRDICTGKIERKKEKERRQGWGRTRSRMLSVPVVSALPNESGPRPPLRRRAVGHAVASSPLLSSSAKEHQPCFSGNHLPNLTWSSCPVIPLNSKHSLENLPNFILPSQTKPICPTSRSAHTFSSKSPQFPCSLIG